MANFLNPYNFVRYLEPERPQGHVLGDCPPPPHDRYVGLTGRIMCKIEAKTPLFISDSHAVQGGKKEHRHYRFFKVKDAQGRLVPALPATSLRGMVRSVFEAATNACFAVFDGGRLEFRHGELPEGLVPARVVEIDAQGAKLELLDCSVGLGQVRENRLHKRRSGKDIPLMKAASVSAYENQVLDTETNEPFSLSRSLVPSDVEDGDRVAALIDLEPVNNGVYQYFRIKKMVPAGSHKTLSSDPETEKVFGYAHITGPNIEKKHLERLFFRWDDESAASPEWGSVPKKARRTVSDKTVQEYNQHLKQYWERNQRFVERLNKKGQPWPVTADDLPHPSYFIQKDNKLRKGDLVYYIPSSEMGMPLLRPVLISRLPYRRSRADLLPDHWHRCKNYDSLCPACRVFGWVHEEASRLGKRERVAYAGRVRFSQGELEGQADTLDGDAGITLAILSTPKPTTTQFYLLKGEEPDGHVTYSDKEARLRGRKVYRHHGQAPSQHAGGQYEYERVDGTKDDQNRTVHGVLKAGATFKFSVDFENLAPVELGALLWSLELEEGMHHRLGYGKPLGFGSVRVTVYTLEVLDPQRRFGTLHDDGWQTDLEKTRAEWQTDLEKTRAEWVKRFKEQMAAVYERWPSFDALPNIQDLKALTREPDSEVIHYPRLEAEPSPEGENFRWFVENKKRGSPHALDLAPQDKRGLPLNPGRNE
jgi:CRISPR-associated protein (TIGR03986 family)